MTDMAHNLIEVLENDQFLYYAVREALIGRLRSGMGYPELDGENYMCMLAHDGQDTVARDAADAVSDAIQELLVMRLGGTLFVPDDPMANLINSMFDFNDRDLWAAVTDAFLPENAEDYDEMLSDYGVAD